MEDIRISFIIPVYNPSEKDDYFSECIESVIKIANRDDEILVIDDGSDNKDYILKVCEKSNNISIIRNNKNLGISSSRNIGINKSKNDFIAIIDSDDTISDINAFKNIRKQVNDNANYDLYIYGSIANKNGKTIKSIGSPEEINIYDLRLQTINRRVAKYNPVAHPVGTVWGKIFKKSFIVENNLSFGDTPNHAEDQIFFLDYLSCEPKIKVINEYAYYYRYNPDSITHKYNENSYELFNNTIVELSKRININETIETKAFLYRKTDYLLASLYDIFRKENNSRFKEKVSRVNYIICKDENLSTLNTISLNEYYEGKKLLLTKMLRKNMIITASLLLETNHTMSDMKNNIRTIINNSRIIRQKTTLHTKHHIAMKKETIAYNI